MLFNCLNKILKLVTEILLPIMSEKTLETRILIMTKYGTLRFPVDEKCCNVFVRLRYLQP